MPAAGRGARGWACECWDRWWPYVLDFCLTLWVLRAPLATLAVGSLLMWYVPQAQDLLVEFAMPGEGWAHTTEFLLLILFVWAMPTHYAARLLVSTDERFGDRIAERGTAFLPFLQKWTPRALGAFTFVIMLGGALRAWRNLPLIAETDLITKIGDNLILVSVLLVVVGVIFWFYAVYRDRIAGTAAIGRMEKLAGFVMRPLRRLLPAVTRRGGNAESHLGPLLLVLMFLAFAAAPIVYPLAFATMMPRALAVPFVLGGWLPLLAYLAALGRRLRAPLILTALVVFTLLPLAFGDNYAIRLINAAAMVKEITGKDAPAGVTDTIELKDAIAWWKKANGCDSGQGACPRPIIVASAGGASRAGFFEASMIGQLLDDQLKIEGKGHGLTEQAMANRLFALSTVSGSSVGAVMTVAAMAAARDGGQPCTQSEPLWRGTKIDDWRSCLEGLMAGDFLTPIFTGFVFHDVFGFLKWRDRGTLLEESVEREFAKLIGEKPQNPDQLACAGSLECPFTTLRPSQDHWLPLLLLNSTSVTSGQRIITSPLEWYVPLNDERDCPTSREEPCQIFERAPLFHDLLEGQVTASLYDVRLSTAAHNSARFPLLSPPGELIDSKGGLIDRMVDGGYFENFGAQTATELAQAMLAIDNKLQPFILVLSNDPTVKPPQSKSQLARPPDQDPRTLLPDLFAPLSAFSNTRNARGELAVDNAAVTLDHHNADYCNTAELRVWTDPVSQKAGAPARELSMSWWLSKPVQIYLHEQTGLQDGNNDPAIKTLLAAIRGDPPPPGAKVVCPEID